MKNLLTALLLTLLLASCSENVADQYITEIERTTKEIKAATSMEMVTAATERLTKFERENYEALREELEGDKMKQASVNRAYEAFMQAGMFRTMELAGATVVDTLPQVVNPTNLPAVE